MDLQVKSIVRKLIKASIERSFILMLSNAERLVNDAHNSNLLRQKSIFNKF